jgi:hypothetical protein
MAELLGIDIITLSICNYFKHVENNVATLDIIVINDLCILRHALEQRISSVIMLSKII